MEERVELIRDALLERDDSRGRHPYALRGVRLIRPDGLVDRAVEALLDRRHGYSSSWVPELESLDQPFTFGMDEIPVFLVTVCNWLLASPLPLTTVELGLWLRPEARACELDRKSTRLNSSHLG